MMNALVSPETGLALESANIAVGDWYVAMGFGRCGGSTPLQLFLPSSDFTFHSSSLAAWYCAFIALLAKLRRP